MLILSLAVAAAVAASPVRLPPVDECQSDASFAEFRAALNSAVERKDINALVQLMSDDVRVSFGGRFGKEGFLHYWQSQPSKSDELWVELADAIKLGCAVKGDGRVFPSMFGKSEDLDGFETWVAREGGRLRCTPSLKGKIVARLSWHVLQEDGSWGGEDWIPLRLPNGRRGFMHKSAVRSLIDYRIVTRKQQDGRWLITAFVAGD